jgi:hypothetical protein
MGGVGVGAGRPTTVRLALLCPSSTLLSRTAVLSRCGVVVVNAGGADGGIEDMLESGEATSWNGKGDSLRELSPDR